MYFSLTLTSCYSCSLGLVVCMLYAETKIFLSHVLQQSEPFLADSQTSLSHCWGGMRKNTLAQKPNATAFTKLAMMLNEYKYHKEKKKR